MFAVIKTGGKQYRVQTGDVLEIEKLDVEEGKKVTFEEVLLFEDNGNTLIGTPFVDKAKVLAVVVEGLKGEKVIVFKKKRRKQYKKKRGHRQLLTRIKIEDILIGEKVLSKKKPAEKTEPKKTKAVLPKPARKEAPKAVKAVKKAGAVKPKESEDKKPVEKKPVEKKAPAKPKAAKKTVQTKSKPPAKPVEKKAEAKPKTKPKAKKETVTKE